MASRIAPWTLGELHRLPDDGNKYELVRGELFVTPPPSFDHEELASVLARMLEGYVASERLGRVYRPRAVLRAKQSEVEPDLMVRPLAAPRQRSWARAPLPILVVEIVSETTRRRDYLQKRALYISARVPEYWIVDGEERSICVVRPGADDTVHKRSLHWTPRGAASVLTIDVTGLFAEASDRRPRTR